MFSVVIPQHGCSGLEDTSLSLMGGGAGGVPVFSSSFVCFQPVSVLTPVFPELLRRRGRAANDAHSGACQRQGGLGGGCMLHAHTCSAEIHNRRITFKKINICSFFTYSLNLSFVRFDLKKFT